MFSKQWTLRDAAILKTQLMLSNNEFGDHGIDPTSLGNLFLIVRVGLNDKMQQVFTSALALLESLVRISRRWDNLRL
jgi:hypothetical protein